MTNEEAIKHITTWLYAAPALPPMQVVQSLELAVNALRAGGNGMNVHTKPDGQPLTLEQLRGMDGKCVKIVVDGQEPLEMLALVEAPEDEDCVLLRNNLGGASEFYSNDDLKDACGQMVDALAATDSLELTEEKRKLDAAERRCETLEKMVKEYQETIIPGYRKRTETAEETASDLCDDFTDFVTGGVHNAAPYCANRRTECVNAHGWCDGDNRVCRGFMPKAAAGVGE